MVTRIAFNISKKDCSVFELLEYVLNKLEMCIHQTEMTFEQYALQYDNSPVLSYKNGKWCVPNPADPDDNLADKWNADSKIPKVFFNWVTTIKKELMNCLHKTMRINLVFSWKIVSVFMILPIRLSRNTEMLALLLLLMLQRLQSHIIAHENRL